MSRQGHYLQAMAGQILMAVMGEPAESTRMRRGPQPYPSIQLRSYESGFIIHPDANPTARCIRRPRIGSTRMALRRRK